MYTIKNLIVFLTFLGGLLYLQVFLSNRENKFKGLILPILNFVISLSIIFLIMGYIESSEYNILLFTGMILEFLQWNIPTVILLIIYFIIREKKKKHS